MKAYLLALAAAAMWGLSPLLDKWVLSREHVSPLLAVALRAVAVALGASAAVATVQFTRPAATAAWGQITWTELAAVCAAGIIAAGVAQWLYFEALKTSEVSLAVPVTAVYPLFAAMAALALRRESLTSLRLAGIVLAVAGCFVLALSSRQKQARADGPPAITADRATSRDAAASESGGGVSPLAPAAPAD